MYLTGARASGAGVLELWTPAPDSPSRRSTRHSRAAHRWAPSRASARRGRGCTSSPAASARLGMLAGGRRDAGRRFHSELPREWPRYDGPRVRFLAPTQGGAVGITGALRTDSPQLQVPWVLRSDGSENTPCSMPQSQWRGLGYVGQVVVTDGDTVYVVLRGGAGIFVQRYDDAACATTCPCPPTWTSAVQVIDSAAGTVGDPRAAVVSGTTLFIAGD